MQNTVGKTFRASEKRTPNYWKLSTFLLLYLLLFFLITKANVHEDSKKNITPITISYVTPTKNQTPIATYSPRPTPTAPIAQVAPTRGKSYGIFYPFSDGVTINNSLPTIIGKISQEDNLYLETVFRIEESPIYAEDDYHVRFIPGEIFGFKVKIDGIEIDKVFGTPQYPTIICKNINSYPGGVSYYDSKTGIKTPPDDFFNSEEECLANKKSEIPPLLFFTKVTSPLSEGKHVLTLEGKSNFKTMSFNIDSRYHLSSQSIFIFDKNSESYYYSDYDLLHGDNCGEGYYYDSNYLKVPIPLFDNPNLYYGISFPLSKEETGNISKRRVQISFENERFDLFFPQASIYYEGKSFMDTSDMLNPLHELFLPKDHLVFTDGSKAAYIDAYSIIPLDGSYAKGYFEVYPVDITGGYYGNSVIPRIVSGSSGCDG